MSVKIGMVFLIKNFGTTRVRKKLSFHHKQTKLLYI